MMPRLVLLLLLMPSANASAQLTARYRYDNQQLINVGGRQSTHTVVSLYTLTRHDSAGGVVCHVVIDSLAIDPGDTTFKGVGVNMAMAQRKGNAFDAFAKDGKIVLLGARRGLDDAYLSVLAADLAPLFGKRPTFRAGESSRDSSFVSDSIPGVGLLAAIRTKTTTHRTLPARDTMATTSQAEGYSYDGASGDVVMVTTATSERHTFSGDEIVLWHSSATSSYVQGIAFLPFRRREQMTETRTLTQIGRGPP